MPQGVLSSAAQGAPEASPQQDAANSAPPQTNVPGSGTPSASATPASAANSAAPAITQRVLEGIVKAGNSPIPGATISAINPSTGDKVVGWTQADGRYKLVLPGDGEYVVRAQMTAFATSIQHVAVSGAKQNARLDLQLTLLSRAQASENNMQNMLAGIGGRSGFQALQVLQGEGGDQSGANESITPQGMPVLGVPPTIATESVAVSGSNSGNAGLFGMSSDQMRQRFEEYRAQQSNPIQGAQSSGSSGMGMGSGPGGGFGGPGGGGPVMLGGRGFNFNQPHGMLYYSANDGSLNATPYSLTGQPTENPSYLQQRFGGMIGGPLIIPHIYNGGSKTFFFLHYNGTLGETPYDQYSTVPTAAERAGNFSGISTRVINPATGQPFDNNTIPAAMTSPAAKALIQYIPLPNLPGTVKNYHYITTTTANNNDVNFRLNQALGGATAMPGRGGGGGGRRSGRKFNNLSFGFHYHSVDQTIAKNFPTTSGTTSTSAYDIPLGYTRSFGSIINNLRFDFNRQRVSTNNLYAYNTDITGLAGITGVAMNPFDWGIPNLSFSHYGSLTDTNPALLRNQTFTITDNMIWNHGKHTVRWGGDFRRLQINTQTDSNPRGSFVFTGLFSGYDFADFLLGLPQQTSAQYSNGGYHFRGNSWDLFVQDEWRARGNLTFNIGLRYEYVSPFTEIDNRIVNLDIAPGLTGVAAVLPGQTGSLTGTSYPSTLLKPDRNNFAPRVGVAWKPFNATVVRAGYGINYNISAYQNIVQNLAFQPPFSFTQINTTSTLGALTLTNGFPSISSTALTNNYAVNPNYRLGYVQIWNLDIQRELTKTLVLNLDYTGTKGTRLDTLEAPNRTASGVFNSAIPVFYYEDSVADSTAHAFSVRLRKRLDHGISIGGTYTFSKALDNASTIGSGASQISGNGTVTGITQVAQNAFDLAAERGLSSFDQRHKFTADYVYELPFGRDKAFLNQPGKLQDILGDWQWSGDWTIASGLPFTPRILGSFTDVSSGVNGTLRPDLTGEPISVANPSILEWFNPAAFVAPATGTYGNARRNSIEGAGEIVFDMAMTKVIRMKETRMLELRISATNVFNHANYSTIDTVLNSPSFGQVVGVGSMRSILLTARYRF